MPSKSTRPVTGPDVLDLTFRGLDLCDGCGSRLELDDRLWGLCPACLGAMPSAVKGTGPMGDR
jgi:predicted amidophosphoribosyltransferase